MSHEGTLFTIYQQHVEHHPNATMLVQEGQAVSYAQFDQQVHQTAAWLFQQGIEPGDHVAVWLINRTEWLVLLFALANIGATLVAVNTKYRAHELQYILTNSQATTLILQLNFKKIDFAAVVKDVDPQALNHLQRVIMLDADASTPARLLDRPVMAFKPSTLVDDPFAKDAEYASDARSLADRNVAFFTTSGTTKGPKLVMHTQRTLSEHAQHVASGDHFGEPGDKLLAALPRCGVFGLNSVLGAIAAGMPVVLMDFFDGHTAARLIQQEQITHVFGSDEMLRRLVEHTDSTPFPSLKTFGFAAFSPRFIDLAKALIPRGIPMRGLYGSSEVMALFSLQNPDMPIEERALGGGYPSAGALACVRARDPESGAVCAPGISGELEMHSPTLFKGYFNNPLATKEAFTEDGFFKTGDLGYIRADGSFVYQSRMGDTMRLGGFLVDPTEIEQVLAEQPEIKSAQVVGIEIKGQLRPVAFVIASDTHSAHAHSETGDPKVILDRLSKQLAAFKIPTHLWFIDAFPATASANGDKFQRVKLRELAQKN
ncbi:AMP-binding protein [Zwartia sp.]|uniref:AMP-binding protein n=1 Tax=Zwartia sp. TaxID=2978004 RepID=UPI002715F920|nr:AMP-binding protein [Zwartia sp.]MDO9025191.1 AMP-binding protein [Zwartia sp.]